uniref:Uncharacterized protein n=1 Tax=Amphimedon queenslandica TaxID=400682 RepID=A0A1X7U109_AMPQE
MNLNNNIQAATCDCVNMSSLTNSLCIQLSFMMDKEKDNNTNALTSFCNNTTLKRRYFIITNISSGTISMHAGTQQRNL